MKHRPPPSRRGPFCVPRPPLGGGCHEVTGGVPSVGSAMAPCFPGHSLSHRRFAPLTAPSGREPGKDSARVRPNAQRRIIRTSPCRGGFPSRPLPSGTEAVRPTAQRRMPERFGRLGKPPLRRHGGSPPPAPSGRGLSRSDWGSAGRWIRHGPMFSGTLPQSAALCAADSSLREGAWERPSPSGGHRRPRKRSEIPVKIYRKPLLYGRDML